MKPARLLLIGILLAVVASSAGLALGEVAQKGRLRVSFAGEISPHTLPRKGLAPVAVSVGGRIGTTNGTNPPQLREIEIAINRNGRLDYRGLPVCRVDDIQPSTTDGALRACQQALVGKGSFSANVKLPEQAPFPSSGEVVAFNGRENGRPVILAHVYGTSPVPTSYTLPFRISTQRGTFGTTISAELPQVTSDWGFVTGLSLTLKRAFRYHGAHHSYLSAGCPAPEGFPGATFPFAKASFDFGRKTLSSVLTRSCTARG